MQTEYDAAEVARLIEGLTSQLVSLFQPNKPLIVVGIRTRGETLAERVVIALRGRGFSAIGRGVLDITLYRDDLSEIGLRPLVRPTSIDADINGKPLILLDDVLFTGRTVRAALDALSDFGRPSAVRLAVLVDRGGRELPIQPDIVGVKLGELSRDRVVKVKLKERDGVDGISVVRRSTATTGS
jgi:pyrimidine operon attenuation protein / uracil phosphoribosyltransferase